MDDIVKRAIAKWPNVPDCYGWLGLDARGAWYMRDDGVQAAGSFPQVKGALLEHDKLINFIARNYESDAAGRWFFQNGPQRVFVELEATPLIWRVESAPGFAVHAHTGRAALVQSCLLDEAGRVYVITDTGVGLVHTADVLQASDAIEQGAWPIGETVAAAQLPARFGYVLSPKALQK